MEQIFAKLLFSLFGNDPETKQKMVRLLQFYRENRELILLLTNAQAMQGMMGGAQTRSAPSEDAEQTRSEQKENRPRETVGSVSILEDYLQRAV